MADRPMLVVAILSIDRTALLTHWARDYAVASTNLMRPYLEPRGLAALWPKLSRLPRYAVTGSMAAGAIAPTRLAVIYVDDQAIYLRAGPGDMAVAPFTTDGDLAAMAVRASAGLEDAATIAASCEVLARRLLAVWERS
jgi:hypothetical protein